MSLQLFFFYEKNIFSCYSNVSVIVSVVILSGPTIMLYSQQALSKCLVREDTGGQTWKDTRVEQRLSLGDSSWLVKFYVSGFLIAVLFKLVHLLD